MRNKILRTSAISLLFYFSSVVQAVPAEQLDIAGIKLGMTVDEVKAAINTFDPQLQIEEVAAVFDLNDGANLQPSPEFLDRIEALQGNQGAVLKVFFSGPVGEVRVIGVARKGLILSNQPASAQFMQSLTARYGQPTAFNRNQKDQPVWEASGKMSCLKARDYKNEPQVNIAPGFGESVLVNVSAEQFFSSRASNNTGKGLFPKEFTDCGSYLSYFFPGDPISSFSGELMDLGAIVHTERSRQQWVEQLTAEAIQKRLSKGQVPKF
ncbi:hypothetical protein AEST_16570 [Alishewanella aestuarii B11]|uniref:Uncharacterized protein n=1 Tax=Alishewanella aestuarii B11 TaxID=1197174 RepID=J1Q2N5_9ALTE|nr:hypothetical protein [Alishewanella aestuarii]EJI85318.1 hypothetical protein AEST_16570 [Alishewanella aestuarii B11]